MLNPSQHTYVLVLDTDLARTVSSGRRCSGSVSMSKVLGPQTSTKAAQFMLRRMKLTSSEVALDMICTAQTGALCQRQSTLAGQRVCRPWQDMHINHRWRSAP